MVKIKDIKRQMNIFSKIFGRNKADREIISANSEGLNYGIEEKNQERQFDAANQDRVNSSWRGAGLSFNQEIRYSKKRLISVCRDLAQNDPYVKKYLRTVKKYVIGPEGFTVKVKSYDWGRNELGKTVRINDSYANNVIEDAFWEWTKKGTCTVEGTQSFRQFLGSVINSKKTDGEVFIKMIYPNKKENPFCFSLQAIEANMVDETLNMPLANGNIIIMGIEYDTNRKPQAYWFRKIEPTLDITLQYYSHNFIRVNADEVIHYYSKEFVGQLRGYPEFVNVAQRIRILKGYEEAALINARSAAMKTMVLKYSNSTMGEITTANIGGATQQADGSIEYEVTPGQVYVVPKGMENVDYNPSYPQGEHKSFTENMMYSIASGFDIDYPTLSSNLSGVNYTSIRHGMLDSRLSYKIEQSDMREDIIEPVFSKFLLMAITSGYLNLPITKFEKFNKPKVIGFTGDWVDPLKDGRAKIEGIDALIDSYEDVLAAQGKDLEEHLDQLAYEKQQIEKRGLTRTDLKGDITKQNTSDNNNNGDNSNV